MPIPARILDRILVNDLGFRRTGRKHRVYVLEIEGREVVRTLISHGSRELTERMLAVMARQMGISRAELHALARGDMGRAEYLAILREKGLLQ